MIGSADTAEPCLLPEVLAERADLGELTLELRVPENLAYFEGHFPRTPIVPGVVQIHWAAHFAEARLGVAQAFGHMEVIKFKELLQPGARVDLWLKFDSKASKLHFSFRSGPREFSSGRLYFLTSDV